MDPGMQAMRDAQRASEQAQQRMNQQLADDAARRAMRDAQLASQQAIEATQRSSRGWAEQQRRNRARPAEPRRHGLIASLLLFPFRLASFTVRLAVLALAIAIIAVAAFVLLGGRLPV